MNTYNQTHINRVIKSTAFWTDRREYVFVRLARKDYSTLMNLLSKYTDQFVEVIYDRLELTLIILKDTWEREVGKQFKATAQVMPIAIISCDVVEPTVTGYLYNLLKVLSPNNIGIYAQGSYTSDHIFVDFENLDKVLKYLNELKNNLSLLIPEQA